MRHWIQCVFFEKKVRFFLLFLQNALTLPPRIYFFHNINVKKQIGLRLATKHLSDRKNMNDSYSGTLWYMTNDLTFSDL